MSARRCDWGAACGSMKVKEWKGGRTEWKGALENLGCGLGGEVTKPVLWQMGVVQQSAGTLT